MEKKKIFAAAAALCLLTGCGNDEIDYPMQESILVTTDILTTSMESQSEPENVSEEPQINSISDTQKEFYFYRDHMKIYGKIYLPSGDGSYPTVIIASDLGRQYNEYEDYASELAANGVISVVFDCTGAVVPSLSDGKIVDMTAQTEKSDIITVLNNISDLPQVNTKCIFLMGDGFGSNVAVYAAAECSKDIRGVILAEPAFDMSDTLKALFPDKAEIPLFIEDPFYIGREFIEEQRSTNIYQMMPFVKKNVIIFSDDADENKMKYSEKAHDAFPSAILMSVKDLEGNVAKTKNTKLIDEILRFVKANKS